MQKGFQLKLSDKSVFYFFFVIHEPNNFFPCQSIECVLNAKSKEIRIVRENIHPVILITGRNVEII